MKQEFIGAVIDIGTNSVRLLVGQRSDNRYLELHRETKITRLGENLESTGIIKNSSFERTLEVIRDYVQKAQKLGAEKIVAFGTAALREAKNGKEISEKLKKNSGISVQIISGEEEAALTFLGTSVDFNFEPRLVIDIGGGSTEVIAGSGSVDFMVSIEVGCVKVLEKYGIGDKTNEKDIETIKNDLKGILSKHLPPQAKSYDLVVALGGTATSLSAINQNLKVYNRKLVHLSKISIEELKSLTMHLAQMTLAERKRIPSLKSKRADVIVPGAIILLSLIELIGASHVTISEHDILDGLFIKSFL